MKAAAFGLQGTVPLGRIRLELGIDLADAGYGLFCVTSGIGGLVGIAFAHDRLEIELNLKKRKSGTESGKEIEG